MYSPAPVPEERFLKYLPREMGEWSHAYVFLAACQIIGSTQTIIMEEICVVDIIQ